MKKTEKCAKVKKIITHNLYSCRLNLTDSHWSSEWIFEYSGLDNLDKNLRETRIVGAGYGKSPPPFWHLNITE